MLVSLPVSDSITYDWSSWLTDKSVAVYNANITDISLEVMQIRTTDLLITNEELNELG